MTKTFSIFILHCLYSIMSSALFNITLFPISAIFRANSERKLQKMKAKQPKPPRFLSSFTHPQAGGWCKGTHLFRICKCAEGFYQLINDRACTYPLFLRLCHNPFTGFLADSPAYWDTLFAEPLATCAFAFATPSLYFIHSHLFQ